MSKKANKTIWVCRDCGGEHLNWSGKCNYCGNWNTLTEMKDESISTKSSTKLEPIAINSVRVDSKSRLISSIEEFNLALGGGIVKGSVILIGGQPGIGKSTLLWQVASSVPGNVGYISAEESPEQIKIRSDRLGKSPKNIYILDDRNIDNILNSLKDIKPSLLVVDSIQTIFDPEISGTAGNIVQVRSCTLKLIDYAKSNSVSVIMIGHVTKEGEVAGPKTLEHLVDGVFYLEGLANSPERFLRASKNRFGPTDEIGIFEMKEDGLRASSQFGRMKPSSKLPDGVSRSAVVEGSRVIFLEIQALVQKSATAIPRRNAVGYDFNRLHMIIAIVSKHLRIDLSGFDVFLTVSEGYRLKSTMADVACAISIISSLKNIPLDGDKIFIGELDLSGAIHLSSEAKKIIKFAEKANFKIQYKNTNLVSLAKNL
jgi:DNA repair protein RadA/Sms